MDSALELLAVLILSLIIGLLVSIVRPYCRWLTPAQFSFIGLTLLFILLNFSLNWTAAGLLTALVFFVQREYFSLSYQRPEDRLSLAFLFIFTPFSCSLSIYAPITAFVTFVPLVALLAVLLLLTFSSPFEKGYLYAVGQHWLSVLLITYALGFFSILYRLDALILAILILFVATAEEISKFGENSGYLSLTKTLWLLPISAGAFLLYGEFSNSAISIGELVSLSVLMPLTLALSRRVLNFIKLDLGVVRDNVKWGRGYLLEAFKAYLLTLPFLSLLLLLARSH